VNDLMAAAALAAHDAQGEEKWGALGNSFEIRMKRLRRRGRYRESPLRRPRRKCLNLPPIWQK
jgi:hypothetical protein